MLIFDVIGQRLLMDAPLVVEDSNAYLEAQFNFHDEDWKTADDIWAHFEQDDKRIHLKVKDGFIEKSANLNLDRGYWKVYLHASSVDGERITTNQVDLQVKKTGTMDGEVLPDIPLSAAEQISLTATEAKQIAQSVRDDADSGVLGGDKGDPGFSPVLNVTEITGGHRITITDAEGSKSVDVMDGDGFSPVVSTTPISGGYKLTIQDKNGSKSIELLNGEKGNPGFSPSISSQTIEGGNNVYITDADGTKKFFVPNGKDGFSPAVEVYDIIGGHNVQITDADGTKYFDVLDGKDGDDGRDGNMTVPYPVDFTFSRKPSGFNNPYEMAYGNGRFVILGQGDDGYCALITTDFVNFKRVALSAYMGRIKFLNGKFFTVGGLSADDTETTGRIIRYSEDGEKWTKVTMPVEVLWTDIDYGKGYYVAIAGDVDNKSDVSAYSTDLVNWSQVSLPAVDIWQAVRYGNGHFIAVTFNGTKLTAFYPESNGWYTAGALDEGYYYDIYFNNGKFFIPVSKIWGESVDHIRVGDALEFEKVSLPIAAQWQKMAFGAGYTVLFAHTSDGLVDIQDACFSADDGETWQHVIMPIKNRRNGAAYGKSTFACMGNNGFEFCNLLDHFFEGSDS